METDAFTHWNETPGSTLWIRGKRRSHSLYSRLGYESRRDLLAGSGKSVLW
jgi:hypothetical protein